MLTLHGLPRRGPTVPQTFALPVMQSPLAPADGQGVPFEATGSPRDHAIEGLGYISHSTGAFAPGARMTQGLTYQVPAGGMLGGALAVNLPRGWTLTAPPTATVGTVSVHGNSFTVEDLTLEFGTVSIEVPVFVSTTVGRSQFTFRQKRMSGGTVQPLLPLDVAVLADGTGRLRLPVTSVPSGADGVRLPLTYTVGEGGMSGGQLEISLPAGWTLTGTPTVTIGENEELLDGGSVVGNTITMTGLYVGEGEMVAVNATATVGKRTGPAQFSARQMSTWSGSLTTLAQAPTVQVTNSGGGSGGPPRPR